MGDNDHESGKEGSGHTQPPPGTPLADPKVIKDDKSKPLAGAPIDPKKEPQKGHEPHHEADPKINDKRSRDHSLTPFGIRWARVAKELVAFTPGYRKIFIAISPACASETRWRATCRRRATARQATDDRLYCAAALQPGHPSQREPLRFSVSGM